MIILFYFFILVFNLNWKKKEITLRQKDLHREYLIKLFVKYEDIKKEETYNTKNAIGEFNILKDLIKNDKEHVLYSLTNLNPSVFFEKVKVKLNEIKKNKEIKNEYINENIPSTSENKNLIINENDEDYCKNRIINDLKLELNDSEKLIDCEDEQQIQDQNKDEDVVKQSININEGIIR
uniref:Uncharacterized protein n=1 Tax=Meloidogyne enterolobii TaxID=390850 RepID=A0A6V7XV88_MELEN|nr:unnamed protein product [Meloidogyne enterolobii]